MFRALAQDKESEVFEGHLMLKVPPKCAAAQVGDTSKTRALSTSCGCMQDRGGTSSRSTYRRGDIGCRRSARDVASAR